MSAVNSLNEANEANKINEQDPNAVEDSTSKKRVHPSPTTIQPESKAAKAISQGQTMVTPPTWGDSMESAQDVREGSQDNEYSDQESISNSQEVRGVGVGRGDFRGNPRGRSRGTGRDPGRGRKPLGVTGTFWKQEELPGSGRDTLEVAGTPLKW